jgi:hypothetical protein
MAFNPFKKQEQPIGVIKNTQEKSILEQEFWDNWRHFFDADSKFYLRAHEIAERIHKKNKILTWTECVEQGEKESFEEDKENYLKLYTERKEVEIERRKEFYKDYDKIIFPENADFLPLNKVEESMYGKDGLRKPDFENFYNKITDALKNQDISLRYFPMIEIEPKGIDVKTNEELEKYKKTTTDSKTFRAYFINAKDRKLNFEEKVETFGSREYNEDPKKFGELYNTNDVTKDNHYKKFGIRLEENKSVIRCQFPHNADSRSSVTIQLRILYDLDNEKAQEIVRNLKKHPWHMAGLLKEVSMLFPIDLYNCIKNQYSLSSKVDAIELNKKYKGRPLMLELPD